VSIIPVYFISTALQPVAGKMVAEQGGQYFGFVLLGTITFSYLTAAVTMLPQAVGGGISSGLLESYLSTPTRIPVLLSGMTVYGFVWTTVRAVLMLTAGWALGVHVAWDRLLMAIVILALIILAYLPIGVLTAAMILAFRTTVPLGQAVLVASAFLGGVYYPTKVIPSWIQNISAFLPLTYGLRALRQTLLAGMPLSAVAPDVVTLTGFAVVLLAVSLTAFGWALTYSRRAGTLAQY
jgi:ABC-2 type transport system permease protein